MNYFFPPSPALYGKLQSTLMRLSTVFLFLISLALTLSPAVRYHTWNVDFRFNHWLGFVVWLIVFSVIHFQAGKRTPGMDPFILPVISVLCGWGLLIIWRLDSFLGLRQSIWMVVASVLFVLGIHFPSFIRLLRKYKYIWLILGLILTALTLVLGTYPGGVGPTLWLNIAGVFLQPSEPLKLLLIVYLAAYFADHASGMFKGLKLLMPALFLISSASILLIVQRDLGTAVVFVLLFFIMVFLASSNYLVLVFGGLFTLAAGFLGYQFYPIIQQRLDTWLNPWADPMGSSYQIVQSVIAIASGGVTGRGVGLGNPGVVPMHIPISSSLRFQKNLACGHNRINASFHPVNLSLHTCGNTSAKQLPQAARRWPDRIFQYPGDPDYCRQPEFIAVIRDHPAFRILWWIFSGCLLLCPGNSGHH